MGGIILGIVVAAVCYFFVTVVKNKFGYDDSLDVFGIHGIGGLLGTLMTGIFATAAIGALIEIVLLRRIYRAPELFQLLATFGVVLIDPKSNAYTVLCRPQACAAAALVRLGSNLESACTVAENVSSASFMSAIRDRLVSRSCSYCAPASDVVSRPGSSALPQRATSPPPPSP